MTEFRLQLECFQKYGLPDLERLCVQRGFAAGIEPSAKFSSGILETRRCLVTLPLDSAFGPTPQDVSDMCLRMKAPAGLSENIVRYLSAAAFVHFGFEFSGDRFTGKCYLELPPDVPSAGRNSDRLQFLGFKWNDAVPAMSVVTRYRLITLPTWMEMTQTMLAVTDESIRPAMRMLLKLFNPDAHHAQPDDVLSNDVPSNVAQPDDTQPVSLLQIEEEGSDRRSYDLNVYDCQFTLSCLSQILPYMTDAFHLSGKDVTNWLQSAGHETLGHVAMGLGRDRRSFVTFYYGARPFVPDPMHAAR